MPSDSRQIWMWMEACAVLDRAERLQRRFFYPVGPAEETSWQPPVDILETPEALWVIVALPGASPGGIEVAIDSGVLIISGERRLPTALRGAAIHRLEIPYGRFERRIELPAGRFALSEQTLADGCLVLGLRKVR